MGRRRKDEGDLESMGGLMGWIEEYGKMAKWERTMGNFEFHIGEG